jgi:hypothetical protein
VNKREASYDSSQNVNAREVFIPDYALSYKYNVLSSACSCLSIPTAVSTITVTSTTTIDIVASETISVTSTNTVVVITSRTYEVDVQAETTLYSTVTVPSTTTVTSTIVDSAVLQSPVCSVGGFAATQIFIVSTLTTVRGFAGTLDECKSACHGTYPTYLFSQTSCYCSPQTLSVWVAHLGAGSGNTSPNTYTIYGNGDGQALVCSFPSTGNNATAKHRLAR